MRDPEHALSHAAALKAAGRLPECEAACRQLLASAPGLIPARQLLAMTLEARGRPAEALAEIDAVLALAPDLAASWNGRGTLLKRMGRHGEALESFGRCLALDDRNLPARNNRANTLREMGRFADALADYNVGLKAQPNEKLLRRNRGFLLLENLRRAQEAAADFEAVLAVDPGDAKAQKGLVQARTAHGLALLEARRLGEARAIFDSILAAHPDDAGTHNHRGATFLQANHYEEALADFDAALRLAPQSQDVRLNRVIVLGNQSRHAEAIAELEIILAAEPANPQAQGMLAGAVMHAGDWQRRAQCAAGLPALVERQAIPPLTLAGYSDDPALLLRNAAAFMDRVVRGITPLPPRPPSMDRIRIAYLSADFRPHPIATQIANVIEQHDRTRFQVIGIAMSADAGTPIRARLEAAFDDFHDITALSDEGAAALLRDLNIDIAVDLHGHTMGGRPGILARRPASISATWLGYPGTTGAKFIDYVIGDPETTPLSHQRWFSERIAQLSLTYMPNDSSRAPVGSLPTRAEAGLPAEGFVFCCFNNAWKIAPAMFDVWMRLLRDVPGSVLWLRIDDAAAATMLRTEAAARGADPHRLVFAPRTASAEDHIARLALADLFLDTVPYNAHATACDALWAGVPVLTCRAGAFAGRVGAGLLNALGLPELIADGLPTYEAMARDLAQSPARLDLLRQALKQNLATQPLFDSAAFTRDLEAVFTAMIERARAGKAPAAFQVHR